MIVTVETGVFSPVENIGVRIEDMVLVTGLRTETLPAEDVERAFPAQRASGGGR
jgi:Xaa-Pro aminopeptidase